MTRIAPQPALVLFDLDDTLCDYAGARVGRLRIAFDLAQESAQRSFDAPIDQIVAESIRIQPHGVDHFPTLFAEYGIDDPAAVAAAATWFVGNRFHGLQLFPDALETLAAVRAGLPGRRLGIVTNGPADVQTAKIELLGLRSWFDFCLISGELGHWKPDRAIFLEALRLGNASAADTVMIGDSPEHDIAGAESCGLRTIWIDRHNLPWPPQIPAPTFVSADLTTLRRLLASPANSQ